MTADQLEKKINTLSELVESINGELEAISWDFPELQETGADKNLLRDLNKFENDLRKTANCLTHLQGTSFPDWGKK